MNWDDDRRAASFVSANDPAAAAFARYVESIAAPRLRPGIPHNIQYALGLFEALNVYGLNYIIDPASSYAEMSEDSSSLDSLNYPYQTLLYRGGDCDDISILFCSMLEVLKIETAFITVPGHIYMAFDTGEKAPQPPSPRSSSYYTDLIEHDGRYWMPLEITIPGDGFYRAWRVGAQEWKGAGSDAHIYPTRKSWDVYQPVSIPGAGRRTITLPEEAGTVKAFEDSLLDLTGRPETGPAPLRPFPGG
jgi:hypothetical protein